ncbi:hypothetical protein [Pararobbsia silviterrae]|uniref:Uncharacterized protein n=1 Tax=Pararobbsia silviterrae TaxID=1792498 RepID=A0A494YE79_9BURK|nr:hypothetical protein [Pararobbsia silviterrae]RKP59028.1 hypothetical protein D7S86_03705 [Pararobbsia silviterrae]
MNATLYCPYPRQATKPAKAKQRAELPRKTREPEPQHHDAHESTPSRLMLAVTATLLIAFLGIISAIMLDDSVKGSSFGTEPAGVSTDAALPAAEALANWLDTDPVAQNATRAVLVTYAH